MPKATKKTVKKALKVTKPQVSEMTMPVEPVMTPPTLKPMNGKVLTLGLIAVVIALITYKAGPWLVPAIADNRPITRFEIWSRLEKSYGAQALDDMVNEKILDHAIAKANIKIDQAKVDEQVKSLETQFEANGGLDEALKQRGLDRKALIKQIETQLSVEELLADKIKPTDEEVKKQYEDGSKTMYTGKKFEEVQASITEEIKQAKLRDAFLAWFADVKKDAKVKTFGL